jgi:hypothetical protein
VDKEMMDLTTHPELLDFSKKNTHFTPFTKGAFMERIIERYG